MNEYGCPCCRYTTILPEDDGITESTCPHACTLNDWRRETDGEVPDRLRYDRVDTEETNASGRTQYRVENRLRLIATDSDQWTRTGAAIKGYRRTDGGKATVDRGP